MPVTLSAEWWNRRLSTTQGEKIVALIEKFHGKPLHLLQYCEDTAEAVYAALHGIGVRPRSVHYLCNQKMVLGSIEKKVEKAFDEILDAIRMEQVDPEIAALAAPLCKAFCFVERDLKSSWSGWEEPDDDRAESYGRFGFWILLHDTILFTVRGKEDLAEWYTALLGSYEKGNFPIGQLSGGDFLVYTAPAPS